MKTRHLFVTIIVAAWCLTLLQPGCGGGPKSAPAPKSDTTTQVQPEEVCDTFVPPETAAAKPPPIPKAQPKPKPEPIQEPEKPKALPRMWDYGADNCLPCIAMMRILNPMMHEYAGKVDIRIINVYQEQQLAMQARIQVIPTQVFYDSEGKEIFRHIGVYPRDSIVAKFREFGWE
ncbi:MAG: thioredoxin domain-containing protein [candidate division WOR-3 bacterium]